MRKATRTISGVTPVAVMAQPQGCPGHCIYCPSFPDIPKSYTPGSPAAIRARQYDYHPRRQVEARLRTLAEMGHPADKVELIVMGGTFLASPVEYQYAFIQGCYQGLNGEEAGSLEEARESNRTACHRCVGLTIETRPDFCGPEEIERMLGFGTTRVELGVQTLDDQVYALIGRGHTVAEVAQASRRLRDAGFKVHYHWMPGLPGSNPERDLELLDQLFADERFRPDGLKLYPTLVVAGTGLEAWFREGRFRPYETGELVALLAEMKRRLPPYVRVSRIMRDIPPQFIAAGCRSSNLGEMVARRLKELGQSCQCIRCREYGHRLKQGWEIGEPGLRRRDYAASGGREVFLSVEDGAGTLFGLLRMRYPFPWNGRRSAIVRELHVYGPQVPLRERQEGAAQHRGLGAWLLGEAERIAAQELGAEALYILSGVGAQEYYQGLGYRREGYYLSRSPGPAPAG